MSINDLKESFKQFASKGNGTEMTSRDITRWLKDGGLIGKNLNSNHVDISFSKVKAKDRNLTFGKLDALVDEMVKKYKEDTKSDDSAAKATMIEKMTGAKKLLHGATQIQKVGGVEKLTDTTQYTGAHKERFDKDGKGRGLDGRSDEVVGAFGGNF